MDATVDERRAEDRETRRKRWTTIVLEERDEGRWVATQTGVDVEGHGETAVEAARNYCRTVEEAAHGE